jgi:hypothetical protein
MLCEVSDEPREDYAHNRSVCLRGAVQASSAGYAGGMLDCIESGTVPARDDMREENGRYVPARIAGELTDNVSSKALRTPTPPTHECVGGLLAGPCSPQHYFG